MLLDSFLLIVTEEMYRLFRNNTKVSTKIESTSTTAGSISTRTGGFEHVPTGSTRLGVMRGVAPKHIKYILPTCTVNFSRSCCCGFGRSGRRRFFFVTSKEIFSLPVD